MHIGAGQVMQLIRWSYISGPERPLSHNLRFLLPKMTGMTPPPSLEIAEKMTELSRLPNVSLIREGLVVRLAKRIVLMCDASSVLEDILRDCIGLSMQMDLSRDEFALLLSEVEGRLGVALTPLSKCA